MGDLRCGLVGYYDKPYIKYKIEKGRGGEMRGEKRRIKERRGGVRGRRRG